MTPFFGGARVQEEKKTTRTTKHNQEQQEHECRSTTKPLQDHCTTTYLYSTGSKIKGILEDIRIALEMAMSAAVPTLKYTNVPFVMSKLLMDNFLLP